METPILASVLTSQLFLSKSNPNYPNDDDVQPTRQHYIPFQINYISGNYKGEYCIEVVHRNFLENYLKILENDMEILRKRLDNNSKGYLEDLLDFLNEYVWTKTE